MRRWLVSRSERVLASCAGDASVGNQCLMWLTWGGLGMVVVGMIGRLPAWMLMSFVGGVCLTLGTKLMALTWAEKHAQRQKGQQRMAWLHGQRPMTEEDMRQEIYHLNGLIGQERMRHWNTMTTTEAEEALLTERHLWIEALRARQEHEMDVYEHLFERAMVALHRREKENKDAASIGV